MREIRLVHSKPQHNVQILQNAQDPRVGETIKSIYRLTSSDDSFTWNPTLTEHMIQFLRFLKDNRKTLVVRLSGFSQDDENMEKWFHQACQWDLIVGLVSNSLESHSFFIYHAMCNQNAAISMFLKIYLYPCDFDSVDAHNSLARALKRTNCLNRLEIKVWNVGLQPDFQNLARTLSEGIGSNRSIQYLLITGWDHTACNYLFSNLVDREVSFDQLILESVGYAPVHVHNGGISKEWCSTFNKANHIGFLSCKDSITTCQCLYNIDSTVFCHLQLTNAGWFSQQIDNLLVRFSESCPNLLTLDVYRNKMEDLTFPRFSALLKSNAATPPSISHRRPLGSLTRFLLDGNPILSAETHIRKKLRPSVFSLFQKIPSLITILDTEAKPGTSNKDRAKLDNLSRCMRSLAIESPCLGMQLPPAAWPILLCKANRMLQGEPSLQAQVLYDVLVNASAVLSSNQGTLDPNDAASISNKSPDREPLWLSLQKLLSWD
ncbi:unnamed protein product [Cylindrotheca closterium]|uniref:Uncharacterized protein n=1 Tax=Cylindrotheca closterium TaxID=2856 RepID=A0AAD2FPV7_9STRA|nr:unnamed protein product [Cylindrotheca closterium]